MSNTYRLTQDGYKVAADGIHLGDTLERNPICRATLTLTHSQILTLNSNPVDIVPAVTGKTIIPVVWSTFLNHAGGTDYATNLNLSLKIGATMGTINNAISGSSDKRLLGVFTNASSITSGSQASLEIDTGDPTGGHADATLTVYLAYFLVS